MMYLLLGSVIGAAVSTSAFLLTVGILEVLQ